MDRDEYKKGIGLDIESLLKSGELQKMYLSKMTKALEVAWTTRSFEIEMYWKRATYYWAFITSIFIAYFWVLKSSNLFVHHDLVLFFVILIGCIFSLAWVLTNISSKFWQQNWEHHINFLESEISGNIYGNVLCTKGQEFHPSISKLNFSASCIILLIWLTLLMHNLAGTFIQKVPMCDFILKHAFLGKIIILFVFAGCFRYFYSFLCKKTEDKEVYIL